MQAGSYSARADRLLLASLLGYPGFTVDEATPLRIRQGVKPSYQNYQLKVRAAGTPNMTVIVSAGFVWIDNHDLAGYGAYACVNDADYTINVPAAGGAGQFRKDTIVASVYDSETAGATNEFRIELIQGPYAASAGATVRGTLPANAQVLADIAIAPSQTSVASGNITDARNYAVAAGGIVPIGSANDMNHPHPGQVRYRTDTDTFVYGKLDGTTAVLLDSSGGSPIGKDQFVYKTADTSRASNTTTAPDPDLQIAVAANAVYTMEGFLIVSGDAGSGQGRINLDWSAPAGATGRWTGTLVDGNATGEPTALRQFANDLTAARGSSTYGATAGNEVGIILRGVLIMAATAGTYSFDWAQITSDTTATKVMAGSWLALRRRA
jgi:hypothetical protein